jgi:hypothetical protein
MPRGRKVVVEPGPGSSIDDPGPAIIGPGAESATPSSAPTVHRADCFVELRDRELDRFAGLAAEKRSPGASRTRSSAPTCAFISHGGRASIFLISDNSEIGIV